MPSDENETDDTNRPIFAVFEGGGAKGIAHVGALQAIEDNGLDVIGVAGTSAGALIAVVTAIGLEAADIMSADQPEANILTRLGSSPTKLLGEREWKSFERLRKRGKWAAFTGGAFGLIANMLLAPRIMMTGIRAVRRKGHFGTANIQSFINRVLRERLEQIVDEAELDLEVPNQVTFAQLEQFAPYVLPLKIVATDVDKGTLEIFDAIAREGSFKGADLLWFVRRL